MDNNILHEKKKDTGVREMAHKQKNRTVNLWPPTTGSFL